MLCQLANVNLFEKWWKEKVKEWVDEGVHAEADNMTPNDEMDEEDTAIKEQNVPQDDIIKHLPHRQTINKLQAKHIQQLI